MRHKLLSWDDVDKLIDLLLPQLQGVGPFDAMIMITRGGIVPGGLLAEALNIQHVLTAAVDFPSTDEAQLMAWPAFLQFPDSRLLVNRRTLIVDDVWGSGRTSTAVRGRVQAAGAEPFTCVFHFNPYRSLFSKAKPDFYGEITDEYIVYPWEVDRGLRGIGMRSPLPDPETS
ncbi:MAG: phosphoribosyltransferase family protein [Phototrophicales bacterium]|nr:MAG: phosphoribosyltransferase [Phototrophicales bacterium]RMG74989.1 MAG: phosphoribosyltransferase [Chloroflexota bacterium]